MSLDQETERLLSYLKESFSSKDTERIRQIEKDLSQLSQNKEEHLKLLIHCITLNEKICPLDLKKSVALYFKNFIIKTVKEYDNANLLGLFKFIISLIFKKNEYDVKQSSIQGIIMAIIESMLKLTNLDPYKDKNFIEQILSYIISFIPQSPSDEQFIPVVKDAYNILNTLVIHKFLHEDNAEIVLNIIFKLIDSTFGFTQMFVNPSNEAMNIDFISILNSIFTLQISICKKIKSFSIKYAILVYNKYSKIALELLSLNILNKENDVLIYFTQTEKTNNTLNIMKATVLRFTSNLIKIFIKNQKEAVKPDEIIPNYLGLVTEIIQLINSSLLNTIKNKMTIVQKSLMIEFDSLNTSKNENEINNGYNRIIFEMLYFLQISLLNEEIKKQLGYNIKDYLLNYIFPLITSTDDEIFQMQNEGEDYYKFISDMFDQRNIKHYRIESCSLLFKITQLYADLPSFIFSFTFQMLEYILLKNSSDVALPDFQNEFPIYYEVKSKSYLIDLFNDEKKIDFCFIIIILLKDHIKGNKIFKRYLGKIMKKYLDKLNSIDSILIKQKLCLFYETFTSDLFPGSFNISNDENSKIVSNIIQFLYGQTMNNKYQSISFQASQSLLGLFSEESITYLSIISLVINKNIGDMIKSISDSDVVLLFDLIYEIVKNIPIQNRATVFDLIKIVSLRLQAEIIRNSKVLVFKCFNILIAFLKGKNALNPNNPEEVILFQNLIIKVIYYIKNPSKIFFEDNIVYLADNFNSSVTNIVCEINDVVFPNINNIIRKDESFNKTSFTYFVNVLRKDKSLTYLKQYKSALIDICLNSMKLEDEESMLHSLLLLIEMILTLPENLSKEEVTNISKTIYSLTENIMYDEGEEEDYFNNLLMKLNLTWVSLFSLLLIKDLKLVIQVYSENGLLIPFFEKIVGLLSLKFSNNILLKIIIIGLCVVLSNAEVVEMLGKLRENLPISTLTILFYLVKKQKNEEISKLKSKMKKDIDCNFVEENEENDEEDSNSLIKNYFKKHFEELCDDDDEEEDPLTNFGEQLKDKDEFLYFKTCLENLKNGNQNLYNSFMTNLNSGEVEYLNELLHVRNVCVQYQNETIMIPRRTVKIKRKNQNP